MSLSFFRKMVNKKLNKLQYRGTKYPYLLSFENTQLDWYMSSAVNAMGLSKNDYYDMSFFPDREDSGIVTSYVFKIEQGPMFDKETLAMFESTITKAPTDLDSLIELLVSFHKKFRGSDWEYDSDVGVLDNSSSPVIYVKGMIKKESQRTYDFIYLANLEGKKAIIILGSILPWNTSEEVSNDIRNIARSVQF